MARPQEIKATLHRINGLEVPRVTKELRARPARIGIPWTTLLEPGEQCMKAPVYRWSHIEPWPMHRFTGIRNGNIKSHIYPPVPSLTSSPSLFKRFLFIVYWRERKREHKQWGEWQKEREKQTPRWAGSPARCWAQSQDPEIMTWAESRCLTNWAIQVPLKPFLIKGKSRWNQHVWGMSTNQLSQSHF